jgi:hypothetical protein
VKIVTGSEPAAMFDGKESDPRMCLQTMRKGGGEMLCSSRPIRRRALDLLHKT